jgi:hypothetical protein
VKEVTYWHLELPQHEVILAEGLPCESYLDTGNRAAFANGGQIAQVTPDFASWRWEAAACAALVVSGPLIEALRRRLQQRARQGVDDRRDISSFCAVTG